MVPFFGIFHPGELARHASVEAPAKASFFGGRVGGDALTRLELEAAYLSGKAPEPLTTDPAHHSRPASIPGHPARS